MKLREFIKLKNKKWTDIILSTLDIETVKYIYDMYVTAYKSEGMDLSVNNFSEIQKKYSAVFLIDIDEDEYPDAFIIYRKTKFGNKIALLATDGNKESKKELIKQLLKFLSTNGWYIEASKKIEKILKISNLPVIDDESKVKEIIKKDIEWIGNGYYKRKLSKVEKIIVKRIYGKPK